MDDAHEEPVPEPTDTIVDVTSTMVFPAPQVQVVPDTVWQIHVEILGGPMDGLARRVPAARLEIGRGAGSDLHLTIDPMVSSRHAAITREGRHYWLEDLGSRNGTFIGDQGLTERILIGPGTTFTVGQTQIIFMPR